MLYLAAGKLIQKVPTQLVFNIFGDAGRKSELCPSSALDPSETYDLVGKMDIDK